VLECPDGVLVIIYRRYSDKKTLFDMSQPTSVTLSQHKCKLTRSAGLAGHSCDICSAPLPHSTGYTCTKCEVCEAKKVVTDANAFVIAGVYLCIYICVCMCVCVCVCVCVRVRVRVRVCICTSTILTVGCLC
jgi:hypothetical protein